MCSTIRSPLTRSTTRPTLREVARRMRLHFMLLMALSCSVNQAVAQIKPVVVRIGAGPTCDFSKIQTAINASASGSEFSTILLVARNQTYSEQAIDIEDKNITIRGGYADCDQDVQDSVKTKLSGAGGAARSIVNIRGATREIVFDTLELADGDELIDNQSYGGAIDITGGAHDFIAVRNVDLVNNRAGYGGALAVRSGSPTRVVIGPSVFIRDNRGAYGGGGIFCSGARLELRGTAVSVFRNEAGGLTSGAPPTGGAYGGGLWLQGCTTTIQAGTSAFFPSVIANNTASGPGGGLFATQRADVSILNLTPSAPSTVGFNVSSRFGGAMSIEDGARVTASNAIIFGNQALEGGGAIAIYNSDASRDASFEANSFGIACDSNLDCNRISGNVARNVSNVDQPGSAIRVSCDGGQANAQLHGTRVSANEGRSLFKTVDSFCGIAINGALVERNNSSGHLFDAGQGSGFVTVRASTVANNQIASGFAVFRVSTFGQSFAGYGLRLQRSIVWQPGISLLSLVSGSLQLDRIEHSFANDLSNVPASSGGLILNRTENPHFANPSQGDYRLAQDSLAQDFVPAINGDLTRDGQQRSVDLSLFDVFGPQDAGAFENQIVANNIFRNGFE